MFKEKVPRGYKRLRRDVIASERSVHHKDWRIRSVVWRKRSNDGRGFVPPSPFLSPQREERRSSGNTIRDSSMLSFFAWIHIIRYCVPIFLFLALSFSTPNLWALPQDPAVVEGEVSFDRVNDVTLHISASDQSIINYSSFNIASIRTGFVGARFQ